MMTEKQFKKYLALYGAAIESWPDEIQAEAIRAADQPAIRGLMIEQRYFEEVLRDNDAIPPANAWLADRIIDEAGRKSPGVTIAAWLEELLAVVLPQSAFALATVLTLGIVIGFALPVMSKTSNIKPVYVEDAAL